MSDRYESRNTQVHSEFKISKVNNLSKTGPQSQQFTLECKSTLALGQCKMFHSAIIVVVWCCGDCNKTKRYIQNPVKMQQISTLNKNTAGSTST